MKWVLIFVIVTSNGGTKSHSDFDTESQCYEAAKIVHMAWGPRSILVQTECVKVPRDPKRKVEEST